jgi:hypothetical protein
MARPTDGPIMTAFLVNQISTKFWYDCISQTSLQMQVASAVGAQDPVGTFKMRAGLVSASTRKTDRRTSLIKAVERWR